MKSTLIFLADCSRAAALVERQHVNVAAAIIPISLPSHFHCPTRSISFQYLLSFCLVAFIVAFELFSLSLPREPYRVTVESFPEGLVDKSSRLEISARRLLRALLYKGECERDVDDATSFINVIACARL